ncbi:MAG: TOBE domain-containing protein [Actinomycetota bacterium]|nr:TOBE domain-containing protein [Actinomycetota bacterium]
MTNYRVAEAAEILGVSDDTVRRWLDAGRLESSQQSGRTVIPAVALARAAQQQLDDPEREQHRASSVSARNRLAGIVVSVKKDSVMAQVELVCGHNRIVSLMSAEAADELGLEAGVRAIASVKSTNVVIERP